MGEKIKDIGSVKINNRTYSIELNKSTVGKKHYEVHLQADKSRIEFKEDEFNEFATSVILAFENLKNLKKLWKPMIQ